MDLKIKRVGLLSCSGEEFPGGTLSRVATLKVLHEYLPDVTTTICVPLFLAGDSQEQDFVKKFPSITIDGCDKRCAMRAVQALGKEPVESIVVSDYFSEEENLTIAAQGLLDLQWKNHPYCKRLAEHIATLTANQLTDKKS